MNMSDMTKKLYPVTGMHCAACAGNVEKIVRKQEGVENADVYKRQDYHLYNSNGYIVFNPDIRYVDGYPGESCYNCLMPGVAMLIGKGYIDEKAIGDVYKRQASF